MEGEEVVMKESISKELLESFSKDFDKNKANSVKENAVTRVGIKEACTNPYLPRRLVPAFSLEVEGGIATDQKRSGRCWRFAATNVRRFEVRKNLNIKNRELSQNYPLFFDKLEKSNFFLENIIKTADKPLTSRLVSFLLKDPIGDGGQWDRFVSLVEKYGICPKEVRPETYSSSHTRDRDKYITLKLREDAKDLRLAHAEGKSLEELASRKETRLKDIYNRLVICLGKPLVEFDYDYYEKPGQDGKPIFHHLHSTPKAFFENYVKLNLHDYVSVINAPTKDKPYRHSFTVRFLGNVVGGKQVRYLNLPIEDLKTLAISQRKDGNAVWFGSDVGQCSIRDNGLRGLDAFDVEGLFSTPFGRNKAERLDYGESLRTHARTLTGVNIEEGKPTRWKVENSWGKDFGHEGFFTRDDSWFNEYVYQVVINKKYLSKEQLAAYNEEPIELEPWDPRGSLAL